ncbi:WAT1-related protein At5g40230 [Linum grandiflorum]
MNEDAAATVVFIIVFIFPKVKRWVLIMGSIRFMELVPFVGMVMVECLDVGLTTLSKAAMSAGMSHFVFVVYSNSLATLILLPCSLFLLARKQKPITFPLICKFFLLALFGITVMQNCVFTGVSYSSPTLASALSQLIPAFTFLLALLFRMEKLDLGSLRSQVKIVATAVCISGAFIVIFYQGPPIFSLHKDVLNPTVSSITASSWVIGGLFLAIAGLSMSIFNIFQASVLKEFDSNITIVAFCCLFGTIQSAVVSLMAEKDPNAWKLQADIELVSVVYSAIVGNVATLSVMSWCIKVKGPVFVAMFKPLSYHRSSGDCNRFLWSNLGTIRRRS